jgi:hypothetical protein
MRAQRAPHHGVSEPPAAHPGQAIQLEEVRSDRAAAADPAVPGDRTGLLVKRYRSIRTGPKEWREVIDAELDTGCWRKERALEEAAAKETGEWLAQTR